MKDKSSFSVETPSESPGFLLWQVTTLWQRKIKTALQPLGLSHSGFVILASLLWFREHETDVTQTAIIGHTKLDKMTVSKSLKKLHAEGLVLRAENEADTRTKTITLTDSGAALAAEAVGIVEKTDRRFFETLTPGEAEQLNDLFIRLRDGKET